MFPKLSRRQLPLVMSSFAGASFGAARIERDRLKKMPARIVPVDGSHDGLKLDRRWMGDFCKAKLSNHGRKPIAVKEVVLFSIPLALPPDTRIYGESFQMLSQTSGTIAKPTDLSYSELKHYRIPQPDGVTAMSGMVVFAPAGEPELPFKARV